MIIPISAGDVLLVSHSEHSRPKEAECRNAEDGRKSQQKVPTDYVEGGGGLQHPDLYINEKIYGSHSLGREDEGRHL